MWAGLAASVVWGSLRILGDSSCPDPRAVEHQLTNLSAGQRSAESRVARVDRIRDRLRLRLMDGEESVLAERWLPATSSCAGLALAAALALAAMDESLPAPPAMPTARLPFITGGPPNLEPPIRRRWGGEVGAVVLGSLADGQLAAGVAVVGALQRGLSPWRGEGLLAWDGERGLNAGGGVARFQRWTLGAGPAYRLLQGPSVSLEIEAEALATLLDVRGSGYAQDVTSLFLDPGVMLGVRLRGEAGPLVPWLGLWAAAWLRSHPIEVQGLPTPQQVPDVELIGGIGLDFRMGGG
jgi:hypothetical protein